VSKAVLDSSVILALARNERIDESALALIDGGIMSTVNVAEVYTKLAELRLPIATVELLFDALARVEPFTFRQAKMAGSLRATTRHVGLSLGDRACLALAIELGATAYTADHLWSRANVGCEVRLLR
jgi:PIN domain nuclease of toxin-antitoxin system